MKERTYTLRGVAPLVMHNERLSDPLDKWTRLVAQISKKQKKTEDDLMELSRREWFGGLYLFGPKEAPGVPERNLERMLRDAASKTKRGKDVQSACIVTEPALLVYEGPKNAEALWESGKFLLRASCKVGQMRVIRSRPMFSEWSLTFTVNYDELVLEPELVDGFVELAGARIGLCDWRPKHGRFIVEKVQ